MLKKLLSTGLLSWLSFAAAAQEIAFSVSKNSAEKGQEIKINVFMDTQGSFVSSFQFTLDSDTSVIRRKSVQDFNTSLGFSAANIGLTDPKKIRVLYSDVSLAGKKTTAKEVLFSVTYTVIGDAGKISPVDLTDSPLSRKVLITPPLLTKGNFMTNNGSVTVDAGLLPIVFKKNVEARLQNGFLFCSWEVAADASEGYFQIEASKEGKFFEKIGSVKYSAYSSVYTFSSLISTEHVYLRITAYSQEKKSVSNIASIQKDKQESDDVFFNITENTQKNINLRFFCDNKKTEITVYNVSGKVLFHKSFDSVVAGDDINIAVGDAGLYFVKYVTWNQSFVKRIIIG